MAGGAKRCRPPSDRCAVYRARPTPTAGPKAPAEAQADRKPRADRNAPRPKRTAIQSPCPAALRGDRLRAQPDDPFGDVDGVVDRDDDQRGEVERRALCEVAGKVVWRSRSAMPASRTIRRGGRSRGCRSRRRSGGRTSCPASRRSSRTRRSPRRCSRPGSAGASPVSSSWTFIRKPPSPLTVTTWRSGCTSLAAIAVGRAKPMPARPLAISTVPGLVGGEHATDPELVQADVGDEDVLGAERLADVPQHAGRAHREVVVLARVAQRAEGNVAQAARHGGGARRSASSRRRGGRARGRCRRSARPRGRRTRRSRRRRCRSRRSCLSARGFQCSGACSTRS